MKNHLILLSILSAIFFGCKPDKEVAPMPDEDVDLGGQTSVQGSFVNIFQQPAANLDASQLDSHRNSDKAFGDIFVTAPSLINGGLGPVFNQNSCENCHVANGKSPFPEAASDLRGLLLRISIAGTGAHGEPLAVPNFGGQLQTKAVFGKPAEAQLSWQEVQEIRQYVDGESVTLTKPVFALANPYVAWPDAVMVSPRIAPAVIGLGLLEAIDAADILAFADPADANGDGISGKANQVWDYKNQTTALGRFGWKASQPSLIQQTAAAYNNDMGITSPYFPVESSDGQSQSDGLPDEPEIDENTLRTAAFYPQSLAVPQRRNWENADVQKGKMLFSSIQCSSCHRPKFTTGQHPEFAFLSYQTIFPYTDMLLHDMGEGLADNRPDYEADGREWRTAPLWGIGLTKTVGGPYANFLHDGRAKTLEEAILWHDGEARKSRDAFMKLTKTERLALLAFLGSL